MKEGIIYRCLINRCIEKLKKMFPEAKFIVFGSQVSGAISPGSDLDIAMDIYVVSAGVYSERSLESGSLEYIAATEGIAV